MSQGSKTQAKGPEQAANTPVTQETAAAEQQPAASPAGQILKLQRKIGNQRVQAVLTGRAPAPPGLNIRVMAPASTIQKDDFDQASAGGDRLRVVTQTAAPSGEVRHWAAPHIISAEGDRVPYRIFADIVRGHRPYSVTVGLRRIATMELVVQRPFSSIQLLHWQQEGHLSIPDQGGSYNPSEGMEFFVRLEPSTGDPIEYTAALTRSEEAVELARVLNGEGGRSLQGMMALAHVVQNRLDTGRPAGQVNTSEHPQGFIRTAYLLRGSESVAIPPSWRMSPSTASREFAQSIINSGGAFGSDPTEGALTYCTTGSESRLESRPGVFQRLGRQVRQGYLRHIPIAGNTFYGRGPRAGSAPPGVEVLCRL